MKSTLSVPIDVDFAGTNPFSLDEFVETLQDHRESRIYLDLSACGLRWSDCKKLVKAMEDFTELKSEQFFVLFLFFLLGTRSRSSSIVLLACPCWTSGKAVAVCWRSEGCRTLLLLRVWLVALRGHSLAAGTPLTAERRCEAANQILNDLGC